MITQDVEDALKRLRQAIDHAPVSTLPEDDARTASAVAQGRIRELEETVNTLRDRADRMERQRDIAERRNADIAQALTQREGELEETEAQVVNQRARADKLQEDRQTLLDMLDPDASGQTLIECVRSLLHERARADAAEAQWKETHNLLVAMERTARAIADERVGLANEVFGLQRQLAELSRLVGTETPIAALDLATTWRVEKAHMMDAYKEAVSDAARLRAERDELHDILRDITAQEALCNCGPYFSQGEAFEKRIRETLARVSSNEAEPTQEETQTAPLGHCPRCAQPLNNLSPGISVVAGGVSVCTSCLAPGETEIARARSL